MKVSIIFGTRPEIIKCGPIIRELRRRPEITLHLINTAQHFDWKMSGSFQQAFDFPPIDFTIEDLPGRGVERFGHMVASLGKVLEAAAPDVVLVQGDTTTALAGALAGSMAGAAVGHVEAGLRSFNDLSPEESNRKIIGQIASVHFAPTQLSSFLLQREGIPGHRIDVVGNPVVDAIRQMRESVRARPSMFCADDLGGRQPVLVTVHRPGNTDRPERLRAVFEALLAFDQGFFFFPAHPRTQAALDALPLLPGASSSLAEQVERAPNIRLMPALDYPEFTKLVNQVAMVVTDSGGVQEEAITLGKRVLTLRPSTPRWEGILAGANRLCPTEKGAIEAAMKELLAGPAASASTRGLFGDGKAGSKIVDALTRRWSDGSLKRQEPSYYDHLPAPVQDYVRCNRETVNWS